MWDLLNGMLGCIALLNKRYFIKNDFYRFEDSFQFDRVPADYEKLVKQCYSTKNPKRILKLVKQLFANFTSLLEENGVYAKVYSEVETIPL